MTSQTSTGNNATSSVRPAYAHANQRATVRGDNRRISGSKMQSGDMKLGQEAMFEASRGASAAIGRRHAHTCLSRNALYGCNAGTFHVLRHDSRLAGHDGCACQARCPARAQRSGAAGKVWEQAARMFWLWRSAEHERYPKGLGGYPYP